MIQHAVYLNTHADLDEAALIETLTTLKALVGQIDGFQSMHFGPNRDLEGKSPDYPWGFVATFRDTAALQAYASDPRHQALGAQLVAACQGGAAGILVFDLEV